MKREFHLTIAKIFGLAAAALVFGCAPPAPSASPVANRLAALSSASLSGGAALTSDSEWRCPDSDNVTLKDNIGLGGYDYSAANSYSVCVSRSTQSQFKVKGSTTSKAICIYPMRTGYTASGGYNPSIGLADTPQCFAITGNVIYVNFKTTADINYFSIVDANYTDQMNSCLSDSKAPCPAHAEGFVQ